MQTDILIIGAGLSGLSLATRLQAQGRDVRVAEARPRLGGRILTETRAGSPADLGPAWFWPGQPRIAALLAEHRLEIFEQYHAGQQVFEEAPGQVQIGHGMASMQGSLRVSGGFGALIEALAAKLPKGLVQTATPITHITGTDTTVQANTADGRSITANQVVLALPPRLAARIVIKPALPPQLSKALPQIPTWMAGQAKAVAIYQTAFWRHAGLSGDAFSRTGPLVEIHDASPHENGTAALFGFIGLPPHRRVTPAGLKTQVTAQLARLFGPQAASPSSLILQDWAQEEFTATGADQQPLYRHPHYGLPAALRIHWDGRLHLSGTEVAEEFGGYIEGALAAAQATEADLNNTKAR